VSIIGPNPITEKSPGLLIPLYEPLAEINKPPLLNDAVFLITIGTVGATSLNSTLLVKLFRPLKVLFPFNVAYPDNCVLLHCVVAISFVLEAAKGCVVIFGTLEPPIVACVPVISI
jgi:hypothetical protein